MVALMVVKVGSHGDGDYQIVSWGEQSCMILEGTREGYTCTLRTPRTFEDSEASKVRLLYCEPRTLAHCTVLGVGHRQKRSVES